MEEILKKMLEEGQLKLSGFLKDYNCYTTKNAEIFNRSMPNAVKINRAINHSYMSTLIDNKVSHMLANPVSITMTEPDENTAAALTRFKRYSAFDRVISEIAVQCALYGYSPVLAYVDANGEFDFIEVDAYSCYFSESKDLAMRCLGTEEEIEYYEVYDREKRYFYAKEGDGFSEISEYNGIKSGTFHLFDEIPLFKIKNNKEELSEHYRVRNIIENLDRLYSDLSSEVESFRLAYLAFTGCDIEETEVLAMIQTGALSLPENAKVEFLTKQLQIQAVLQLIEKEEDNLFIFAGSFNPGKAERMGNMTNLGLQLSLSGLNNNVKKSIHYMKEGLYTLFRYYSYYLSKKNITLDVYSLDFEFSLNDPKNLLEQAQVQQILNGLVSTQSRLKLATFIDSPDEEIERMKTEGITIIE